MNQTYIIHLKVTTFHGVARWEFCYEYGNIITVSMTRGNVILGMLEVVVQLNYRIIHMRFKYFLLFTSSRKYYYYRRPTCLIGDLDMLHRRLTSPIGDRHAPSETDMPAEPNRNFNTLIFLFFLYFLLIYILE